MVQPHVAIYPSKMPKDVLVYRHPTSAKCYEASVRPQEVAPGPTNNELQYNNVNSTFQIKETANKYLTSWADHQRCPL